jgi:hypothetical protein
LAPGASSVPARRHRSGRGLRDPGRSVAARRERPGVASSPIRGHPAVPVGRGRRRGRSARGGHGRSGHHPARRAQEPAHPVAQHGQTACQSRSRPLGRRTGDSAWTRF